jgi:hypothetical protein
MLSCQRNQVQNRAPGHDQPRVSVCVLRVEFTPNQVVETPGQTIGQFEVDRARVGEG